MSELRPAYAFVECMTHGRVGLTQDQFAKQASDPDSNWLCPVCGHDAWLDVADYVSRHEKE